MFEKYQKGEFGTNLLFKYETPAFTEHMQTVLNLAFEQAIERIRRSGALSVEGFFKRVIFS